MASTQVCDPGALTYGDFFKKQVEMVWNRKKVLFDIPYDVFSSHEIDKGTVKLLRNIKNAEKRRLKVLDVGCGYGPVGAFLEVNDLADRIIGLERDVLAVAYARRNAEINSLERNTYIGGVAYEPLETERDFDMMTINLPAKAGEPVHRLLLLGVSEYLQPEAEVWCVVVAPLEPQVDEILDDRKVEVLDKSGDTQHVVYRYRFNEKIRVSPINYQRTSCWFSVSEVDYKLDTVYGLADFDSLPTQVKLTANVMQSALDLDNLRTLGIVEPGQGHLAVFAAQSCGSLKCIRTLSRDALSLFAAKQNLDTFEKPTSTFHHDVAFPEEVKNDEGPSAFLAMLREKEGLEVSVKRIHGILNLQPESTVLFSCASGFGGRLEKELGKLGLRTWGKKKRKGVYACCVGRK